jgi:hypothetical protein
MCTVSLNLEVEFMVRPSNITRLIRRADVPVRRVEAFTASDDIAKSSD